MELQCPVLGCSKRVLNLPMLYKHMEAKHPAAWLALHWSEE